MQGSARAAELNLPTEWQTILEGLNDSNPADGFSAERWQTITNDSNEFLRTWGEQAHKLGWRSLDLFGVQPIAPAARYDMIGLIPLLNGGNVVALTETSATIRCRISNSTLTYRRADLTGNMYLSQIKP